MGTQPALWYINVYKCQSRSVKMISILPWEPRFFSCNHSQVHPTMKISKQAWTLELDIVGETSGERRSRLGNHRHYNRHTYSILFQSLFQSSCVYIHHNIYIYIYRYTFYNIYIYYIIYIYSLQPQPYHGGRSRGKSHTIRRGDGCHGLVRGRYLWADLCWGPGRDNRETVGFPHGKKHGNAWNIHGKMLEIHGISWNMMEYPWNMMESRWHLKVKWNKAWIIMES